MYRDCFDPFPDRRTAIAAVHANPCRWCQLHLAEYGKHRVLALMELIAEAYKIKRSMRNDLIAHVETFSQEFGSAPQ
jgi:hypothetical protein